MNRATQRSYKSGFTLVEILVVIAIIGLLAGVVLVGLGPARQRARDTRRLSDINQIRAWAEANSSGGSYVANGSNITNDPLGVSYYYHIVEATDNSAEPVGTLVIGACLETSANDNTASSCPEVYKEGRSTRCSDIATAYNYCVKSQ